MPVEYEKRDHIGIVTLSRPTARNAWGADFNEGIERHFDAMEEDDDIRCAILTGDESGGDRKSTRLNSSHSQISYAVFCLKKKKQERPSHLAAANRTCSRYGREANPI